MLSTFEIRSLSDMTSARALTTSCLRTIALSTAVGAACLGVEFANGSDRTDGGAQVARTPWESVPPAQRQMLAPLASDWSSLNETSRQKWMQLSVRMQRMPEHERQRIQQRMLEWARLPPAERAHARVQFIEAQGVSSRNRQSQWESFQALPPEAREALAQRARATASAPPPIRLRPSVVNPGPSNEPVAAQAPDIKPPSKPVSPTLKKAQLGATTTLVSKVPSPPAHQRAGLPKIAGTPDYVDESTLLPRKELRPATSTSGRSDATPPARAANSSAPPAIVAAPPASTPATLPGGAHANVPNRQPAP